MSSSAGVDVATNPRAPALAKIVQPEEIQSKTGECVAFICLFKVAAATAEILFGNAC